MDCDDVVQFELSKTKLKDLPVFSKFRENISILEFAISEKSFQTFIIDRAAIPNTIQLLIITIKLSVLLITLLEDSLIRQ
jgi:hypothetical protein